MLQDIVFAKALPDYKLHLRFEDNLEGVVDLKQLIEFKGIFEPLRDPEFFARVRVDPDLGTVCWENSADLDPQVLYTVMTSGNNSQMMNPPSSGDISTQSEVNDTPRQRLLKVLDSLSEEQVLQILNYAEFLYHKQQEDSA